MFPTLHIIGTKESYGDIGHLLSGVKELDILQMVSQTSNQRKLRWSYVLPLNLTDDRRMRWVVKCKLGGALENGCETVGRYRLRANWQLSCFANLIIDDGLMDYQSSYVNDLFLFIEAIDTFFVECWLWNTYRDGRWCETAEASSWSHQFLRPAVLAQERQLF